MSSLPSTGARSSTDTLTLSSPDAFLASVPHMLGFACDDSLVLVGLGPDESGSASRVVLTQRMDMPPAWYGNAELQDLTQAAAQPMKNAGSTEVIIAVFGRETPDPSIELPSTRVVDALVTAIDDSGMDVKDALYTDGVSRWSYGCDNPSCCPPEGRVIPQEVRTHVAAEFAVAGAAMAPDRSSLVDEVAPGGTDVRSAVAEQVEQARLAVPVGRSTSVLEAWRDGAITDVTEVISSDQTVSADAAGRALVGLGDVRVRDTVLWEVSQSPDRVNSAVDGLSQLVRSAPDEHVAPASTVLAIVHWMRGDGARANVALDRAMADNPEYSLGCMVRAALRSGLPPQSWRDAMSGLSRDTCRRGMDAPGPAAAPAPAALSTPPVPSTGLSL
jgi:hypothetical protein